MAAKEHQAVDGPGELDSARHGTQVSDGRLGRSPSESEMRTWRVVGVVRVSADRVVDVEGELRDLVPAITEPEPGNAALKAPDAPTGITRNDVERPVRLSDSLDRRGDRLGARRIGRSEEHERQVQLVGRQPPNERVERADFGEGFPGARSRQFGERRGDEQTPARRVRQWLSQAQARRSAARRQAGRAIRTDRRRR